MQNHYEISSKYHFWTRNVRNWTKSPDLVMSGPVQEDPYGPHMGPYGPIRAPTRTGPQPGLGPNPGPGLTPFGGSLFKIYIYIYTWNLARNIQGI